MFKIDPPLCPSCRNPVDSIQETVKCAAGVHHQHRSTSLYEYTGDTEVDWDSQSPSPTPIVECINGHLWKATITDGL
jgi:hypothetical protein